MLSSKLSLSTTRAVIKGLASSPARLQRSFNYGTLYLLKAGFGGVGVCINNLGRIATGE